MSARVVLASLLFSLVVLAPRAHAQAPTVLVLPWSIDDEDGATLAAHAERVAGAIATGDASAISVSDARARFEEHGSSDPPTMSDGDLDRWLALSRQAVRHLAHADYAAAARTLLEAQALSEPAAAELNREETRARQVLDTCLYDVRALLETNDPRAEARALECRRLVPRIAPSPYQHTPEVVALMARIDHRLESAPPGSLRLESTPPGCHVRLNGIPLGETPFVSEDLATGEYRAQIECGDAGAQRGRIHRIRVGEGTSTVRIDVRFDSVVRTDTALRLVYASATDAEAHREEDAVTTAAIIGAREVWLVSSAPSDADVIRIVRIDVPTATVLGSVQAGSAELPGAITTLFGAADAELASVEIPAAPIASPAVRADWEIGAGIGLGVLAVSAYATSFVLVSTEQSYGQLATQPLVTDPDYLSRRQAWTSWELPALALGWTGAALGSAAVALAMQNDDGVPWWSWTIGGAGAGVVIAGLAIALSAPTCGADGVPTAACTSGTALADVGSTIASLGVPLLSVPIVHFVRSVVGAGAFPVVPSASVTDTSASVTVGGVW